MAAKINEGMAKGIVNIAVANPILETLITARVTPDFYQKGFQTGEYVKTFLGRQGRRCSCVPGPAGQRLGRDLHERLPRQHQDRQHQAAGRDAGEASVLAQLRLVEDALQTYPDLTVIWGGALTAEAAIGAVADGRDDVRTIISSYENQTMLKS